MEIFAGGLDIEFGWDWSVRLGTPLGDGHREFFFSVSGIFSGKPERVTLLGFECTVNPQNLINFVGAIFEKIENFITFSYVNYP